MQIFLKKRLAGKESKKSRSWVTPAYAIRVRVGASLLLTLVSSLAFASPGSNWSQEPSWQTTDIPLRRTSAAAERYNVSPFTPGSNNLALDVGQVFLMGDLGSNYDDSIGAQLHYTYGVSDLFGFDTSLGYSEHSDGNFGMTTLLTGLRTNLSWYDKVVPYLVFGLGFYKPSYQVKSTVNDSQIVSTISPVLFGVHMGPGVDLELTKQLFFGAALTFHDVFGTTKPKTGGGTLDVGGTYTSFLLHVGVTF